MLCCYEAQRIQLLTELPKAFPNARKWDLDQLMVVNVDAYQGRENEVVILLCTRSNEEGSIGFLDDHHRLTVAFSRARHGLIVICDLNCLTQQKDTFWLAVSEFFRSHGAIKAVELEDAEAPIGPGTQVLVDGWRI